MCGVAWEDYYRAIEGRAPRRLFLDALDFAQGPGIAVDLGCGDGTETLALLADGWAVVAPFHEAELPQADLVYAGLSLPFCDPADFGEAWTRSAGAVRPGGVLAAHFFGPRDSWAGSPDMTFHARDDLDALLEGFEIRRLEEQDEDGAAVSGPKHWHVFHVIAQRKGSAASAELCGRSRTE